MHPSTRIFLTFILLSFLLSLSAQAKNKDAKGGVDVSTVPMGSPFFRHLAYDYDLDIKELIKFEKKGFGRAETITIVLISLSSGKPLKHYGKRRLKEKVPLKTLAKEANLHYPSLYKIVRQIKEELEEKGDRNLPPPVFESPKEEKAKDKEKKEKKKKKKKKRKKN